MDIYELKKYNEQYYKIGFISLKYCDVVAKLIDAEIARQSVSDQDVQIAIGVLQSIEDHVTEFDGGVDITRQFHESVDLAITALEQMRTEPCEYGGETTVTVSAKEWIRLNTASQPCSECKHYVLDFNYCPNCGRKLGDE